MKESYFIAHHGKESKDKYGSYGHKKQWENFMEEEKYRRPLYDC